MVSSEALGLVVHRGDLVVVGELDGEVGLLWELLQTLGHHLDLPQQRLGFLLQVLHLEVLRG